jgi:hypothetical protein
MKLHYQVKMIDTQQSKKVFYRISIIIVNKIKMKNKEKNHVFS